MVRVPRPIFIILLMANAFLVLGLTDRDTKAETRQFSLAPGAAIAPKTAEMAKIGHNLRRLYDEFKSFRDAFGFGAAQQFKPRDRLLKVFQGRVAIEAVAAADAERLLSDLRRLNLQNVKKFKRHVSGQLPIGALIRMAALDSLKFVRPALFTTNAGLVQSQGDFAMRADRARPRYSVDGSGIKIGTLSDSFDCQNQAGIDVANGDLPPGIQVLDDAGCPTSNSDEGRALMQIVADIAPGADQAFHTAIGGQAAFAQGILDLADAGCDIIVDDVIYFAEPMFQDGIIAQAVDSVVDRGIAYFSSAGNSNRRSYESAYSSSGVEIVLGGTFFGIAHDYDPGPGVDILQQITLPGNASLMVSFQWDSPSFSVSGAPGSPNDLDIFVVDGAESTVLAGSTFLNTGADPIEVFVFNNPSNQTALFNLLITRYSGLPPALMKVVILNSAITINEYDTASGTLFGHANTEGAAAVAAAFYRDTPVYGQSPAVVETFSSAGGVPILFGINGNRLINPVLRNKPDITAPDGVNTTFFGSSDVEPDGFPNFFGTSAAAPHAAAVAGLLLERDPTMAPQDIYQALKQTALDMDDPAVPGFSTGFDFGTGWGLLQADQAVGTVTSTAASHFAVAAGLLLLLDADDRMAPQGTNQAVSAGITIAYVEQNAVCGGKTPCFSRIQAAIDALTTGKAIINISNQTYFEDLVVSNLDTRITLRGGWHSDFVNRDAVTTVIGRLEIADGSLIHEDLVFEGGIVSP